MTLSVMRRCAPHAFALAALSLLLTACGGGGGGSDATTFLPAVSIANASVLEGNSGTTTLIFTVSLDAPANGDVTVDYATGDGTATTADGDYVEARGTLTIPAAGGNGQVTVTINGDTIAEGSETLTLTLSNVSANASLGTATAIGTILNDDVTGALNDTGITLCGDYAWGGSDVHNNDVDCAAAGATATVAGTETANGNDPVPAGQDAHFGRDVTANDDSDGHAGFSFTKIDSAGNPLPTDAVSWECVLDNVTGLMWEVKTTDGGLRDRNWIYTWYNSDAATNGGSVGTAAGGACGGTVAAGCDTEKYVAQVNANGGICGYTDWRMPTVEELPTLVDSSIAVPGPTIDTAWFPAARGLSYWSSSPLAGYSYNAWLVNFRHGGVYGNAKNLAFFVRLVRGGQ